MIGRPIADKELRQALQDIVRVQPPGHDDCQVDSGELVDHSEHAEHTAVMGPVLDEVVRPDMVGPARLQPDAGAVSEPETAPLGLLPGDLQPLPPPDPLDPLGVDPPALGPERRRDPAIAISTVLCGEPDDGLCEALLILSGHRAFALGRAVLAHHTAGSALRNLKLVLQMLHATPATGGAQ